MRYLQAPEQTFSDKEYTECMYDVLDVSVADDELPNFLKLSLLQCPVTMVKGKTKDSTTRRRRKIRLDYKRNVKAVEHCIQRFTGDLLSESDDELPFICTMGQREVAAATGVLPSSDEVALQKQQLAMAAGEQEL